LLHFTATLLREDSISILEWALGACEGAASKGFSPRHVKRHLTFDMLKSHYLRA